MRRRHEHLNETNNVGVARELPVIDDFSLHILVCVCAWSAHGRRRSAVSDEYGFKGGREGGDEGRDPGERGPETMRPGDDESQTTTRPRQRRVPDDDEDTNRRTGGYMSRPVINIIPILSPRSMNLMATSSPVRLHLMSLA